MEEKTMERLRIYTALKQVPGKLVPKRSFNTLWIYTALKQVV